MPIVESVNVGRAEPNPHKPTLSTGIGKRPQRGPVEVRAPGPRDGGLGSGLVGDFIGDTKHHGGDEQAVYAYAREDLDWWEGRLTRDLPDGSFGENLTTLALDVTGARLGERWRIGDTVELKVTGPRIPCATFRGRMGLKGWLKTFAAEGKPGAYLAVVTPGFIQPGDPIEVLAPDHAVTIGLAFRAMTTNAELLPQLLAAGDDLIPEMREQVASRESYVLD